VILRSRRYKDQSFVFSKNMAKKLPYSQWLECRKNCFEKKWRTLVWSFRFSRESVLQDSEKKFIYDQMPS